VQPKHRERVVLSSTVRNTLCVMLSTEVVVGLARRLDALDSLDADQEEVIELVRMD